MGLAFLYIQGLTSPTLSVMYFDQLLFAACKLHVVYFDQLLGGAHYIHIGGFLGVGGGGLVNKNS